ncbi:MAG: hypothetical protein KDC82_04740 [Bacteroidetes bacterium]|nr:hypothetical protein [Bacteroidota bacterium]
MDALSLLKLKPTDKIIDLGAGDGKIVLAFSRLGYEAYGVEINPFLFIIANLRLLIWGKNRKSRVYFKDLNTLDLRAFDVIYCYLGTKEVEKLAPRFKRLKEGARIVSNTFKIKDLKPKAQIGHVYLYEL